MARPKKTEKPQKAITSTQSLSSFVKSICDVMRRSNCASALQYVPELTWIFCDCRGVNAGAQPGVPLGGLPRLLQAIRPSQSSRVDTVSKAPRKTLDSSSPRRRGPSKNNDLDSRFRGNDGFFEVPHRNQALRLRSRRTAASAPHRPVLRRAAGSNQWMSCVLNERISACLGAVGMGCASHS
jgi:hypothetical protein